MTRASPFSFPPHKISIHALLTEGDKQAAGRSGGGTISIHALLTEGDLLRLLRVLLNAISIHALLTEGDNNLHFGRNGLQNFNPRPPHGG